MTFCEMIRQLSPNKIGSRTNYPRNLYFFINNKDQLLIHWENGEEKNAFDALSVDETERTDWRVRNDHP